MALYEEKKRSYILFLPNIFPEDCPDENEVLQEVENSFHVFETEVSDSEEEEPLPDLYGESSNLQFRQYAEPEDYDELPAYFIDLKSWPKSVNAYCWECSDVVRGMPWIVPIGRIKKVIGPSSEETERIFEETKGSYFLDTAADTVDLLPCYRTQEVNAFIRHGCFCTPFCASGYIRFRNDPKIRNRWEAMKLLKDFYHEVTGREVEDIPVGEDKTIMMQYCGPKGITLQEFRLRNESKKVLHVKGT
jgi:hypothetical protein